MTDKLEQLKALLEEPNISGYDWSLGSCILANWKAGLPARICQLFSESKLEPKPPMEE